MRTRRLSSNRTRVAGRSDPVAKFLKPTREESAIRSIKVLLRPLLRTIHETAYALRFARSTVKFLLGWNEFLGYSLLGGKAKNWWDIWYFRDRRLHTADSITADSTNPLFVRNGCTEARSAFDPPIRRHAKLAYCLIQAIKRTTRWVLFQKDV